MTTALLVANILLWLLVIGLAAVVFALARQIGVLHERIAPAGALLLKGGPKVGEQLPAFALRALDGREIRLGGPRPDGRSTLLFFLSPSCPVCKTLLPVLRSSRRSEADWLNIVLASDGDLQAQHRFVTEQRLDEFPYLVSAELGLRLEVSRLPYAVLVDEQGVIRAKGLVNSREHLESLFEARERGVGSLQDFLEQRAGGRE